MNNTEKGRFRPHTTALDTAMFFFPTVAVFFSSCEQSLTDGPKENLFVFEYVMKGLSVTLTVYMSIWQAPRFVVLFVSSRYAWLRAVEELILWRCQGGYCEPTVCFVFSLCWICSIIKLDMMAQMGQWELNYLWRFWHAPITQAVTKLCCTQIIWDHRRKSFHLPCLGTLLCSFFLRQKNIAGKQ